MTFSQLQSHKTYGLTRDIKAVSVTDLKEKSK